MSESGLQLELAVPDDAAMQAFGARLATVLHGGILLRLNGDLGAGKTTLTRGLLRALGVTGAVRSPTFTMVESYEIGELIYYHLDLYRLVDPEELEFLGVRDYLDDNAVCIVEWPGKGDGVLPIGDLEISIQFQGDGRNMIISSLSDAGLQAIEILEKM